MNLSDIIREYARHIDGLDIGLEEKNMSEMMPRFFSLYTE